MARPRAERAPARRDVGACVALRRVVAGRLAAREPHAVCGRRRGPGRRRRERAGWIERHGTVSRTTHVTLPPSPLLSRPRRAPALVPACARPLSGRCGTCLTGVPGLPTAGQGDGAGRHAGFLASDARTRRAEACRCIRPAPARRCDVDSQLRHAHAPLLCESVSDLAWIGSRWRLPPLSCRVAGW